jgi:hypothetical protein
LTSRSTSDTGLGGMAPAGLRHLLQDVEADRFSASTIAYGRVIRGLRDHPRGSALAVG